MNKGRTFTWRLLSILVVLTMLIPATLFVAPVPVALADDTGWRNPTANQSDSGGDGNGFERNPTRAYTNGSGYAESRNNGRSGGRTDRHRYYNYGINIPAGSTIQGIEVRLDWWLDSTYGTSSLGVDLSWNGGSSWTSSTQVDTGESTSSSHTITLGGTGDTWGRTWSASDFSNGNFRVRLHSYSSSSYRDFRLDWVPVRITYEPPNTAPNAPTSLLTDGSTNPTGLINLNPVFSWSAFSDPDGDTQDAWEIEVNTASDFGGTVMWDSGSQPGTDSWDTYAGTIPLTLDGNTYYWRVRVNDGEDWSAWSATQNFTMLLYTPPGPPTGLFPTDGSQTNSDNPLFGWDPPDTTLTHFQVQLRTQGGTFGGAGSHDSGEQASTSTTLTTYQPTGWNLGSGTYCWHVRVGDDTPGEIAWGDWSAVPCFTVDRSAPQSTASTPADYVNSGNITVNWTASDTPPGGFGVDSVSLWYKLDTGGTWTDSGLEDTSGDPSGSFSFPPPGNTNGTYYFETIASDGFYTEPSPPSGNGDDWTIFDNIAPTSQANPPPGPINAAPIVVPWTGSDNASGIATNGVRLWYNFGGGSWTDTGLTEDSDDFDFTPPNGDGTYCFYTIATDNAGNAETAPGSADGCTVYRILTTIGDLVWLDTNGDGLQNDGSTGIDGVTVELYGDGGAPLLDTDVTSGGGLYLFEDLDADDYVVEVDGNSPPLAGYSATTPPTHDVSVGPGIDYEAADFGFGPFATIGDTIFEDDDRDGDHDSGEDGMPDITVWLYTDGNGNGLIDGSDGEIDDTVTDGDGLYTFRGVALGDYTVLAREDDPDLPGAFQPTGDNPVAVTVAVAGVAYADADIGFNTPPPETKLLYLRPGDLLDRNLPTGYHTTHQIDNNSNNTWVQAPTMEGLLQFSGGNIVVWLYMDPTSGFDIWGNENQPTAEVTLWYNGAMIGTPQEVNNMTGAGQFYPFYFTAPASIVPGGAFSLQVAVSDCSGTLGPSGNVVVSFDSAALNSRIELPVYSYIRVDQVGTYDGAYPGGIPISTFIQGGTAYVRVTASDPFGAYDISGAVLTVPGVVADAAMTEVDSSSSSKTFETALPGLLQADYAYTITVTEGLEGEVWDTAEGTFRFIVSDLGSSTKTVDQPTASPGDTLEYTIVLRNTGDLEATVDVDDVLPPNVTYVGGSVSGGTWVLGSNTIEYNGTVPDHDEVTISYEVTVNTPLDNGTVIANDVTIDDGFNSFETTPPAETTITSAPNLSTSTKDVDQATAFPGDTLEYTIVLVNTGDMNAYIEDGDPLLDPIPDNTNFNGGLYASSGDISHDTGFDRVEWYGIVPAGGSVTLRFRAQIDYPLDDGTVITNTAAVNEGVGFPIPNTYYPFDTTTVESAPDLESHSIKLVDRATASPDDILAYTVRLQNDGDMNAVDVEMTDVLPDDVTWGGDVFMSSTGGDYLAYTPGNRTVTWRGDVNAGENVQIFFRANVNSPLPNNSQIVNTAHVADIAGNFTPFDLDAFTTVESSPYLGNSTKDVDLTIAQPDDILTYDITLVNEGNAVADASLLDTLAAELENPVLISWDNGSAEIVGGNQISWTGQITPGQDVVISFQADLLPVLDNGIEVENTALVDDGVNAAFYVDPPAVTEITSAPDLDDSVKTVDHATASPGDELVYTIALDNGGNMVADTLVRDVLPNNVTFVGGLSATSGAPLPTYSSINNRVSWNGDVAPGTPITFSYRVQIATPLDDGTVILNDAEIDDGAHTPFETAPPAETTISSAPDLSTSFKWVDRTNASPDDLLHYRVTLINSGDMIATGVSLSDIMPTDVTFASGPFVTGNGSGGYNPVQRRVYWNGFVAPGDDVDVDYYVNVNTPLPNGTTLVNDALIAGDDFNDVTTNQVNTTVSSFHEFVLVKNA
ncbi:MAG: DUF11 domain-containing protein, partial [Chloroflexi bacterium]|nr:DUF11 domain-containing protein [Chloroflexota bacterium]